MKKNRGILLTFSFLLMILLFSNMSVLAADLDPKVVAQNASRLGIWTILPPVIAIVLAFITKNVVISLAVGVFSGSFLLQINGNNIFGAIFKAFLDLINRILNSLADPWNAGIILQCMVIGGLIAVISKMGGAKAVAESLAKKAKTPKSAQIITWFLGLLVFFDDYANALIVGPIMRPVADKMKISREKLAFIIDGTAAPIAGIAVISTWIGYEISLIKDAYASIGQSVNAYGLFLSTIPYRFYNILILVFIVLVALMGRDFGPMLKAERRARTTGKLLSDTAKPMVSDETTELEPREGIKLSIWNAIIPIGILIIGAFAGFYYNGYQAIMGGEDKALIQMLQTSPASFDALRETFSASDASVVLFQSALLASIVAIIMGASQKIFKVGEAIDVWITGMKSLIITAVILLLAWSLSAVIKELGTATFLVSILSNSIPKFLLPSIIFIFGSVISFATGSAYGTMGILMPLTIPLAYAISPDHAYVVMSGSAVLTGAIFGDHCSPISDTTIMSSMGSACDHLDHTSTQMVYALTIAACTILFGYIPAGLGLPIYIVLPLSIILVAAVVRFIGKPNDIVEEKSLQEETLEMNA
ncbi:Na+/H+ antiporter NhaC family protein [Clostridium sporogenes]|uniref:Na+/H+ antiporter NhaC family protein n=1 Tax=Clostridium sporogenes TaxID=1509 RepID=UPI0013D7FBB4|nr:Na+/H+ antiporter NhaC family protein [Clostridium sporogenes]NFF68090.1 Na+/H+ antiporter NhaC family protein [Clostridium sporogenes]NFF99846.1 Na+/H+ antiporter NhaC family protein [Clostridium sporogenes]NFG07634.1 Na+/H+ antiporter NhaC family protein [Clostridium sporogenes]NFG50450.1 Na+/H+ antiporter NhaC family protein [Clostridium sporogenes]NFP85506.1 Na+/H+ antiporter NhaC family protein [Clostridium sporogenes]